MKKAAVKILIQCFSGHMFLFLLGKYRGMQLLGHRGNVCLTLQEIPNSPQSDVTPFDTLMNERESSSFSVFMPTFGIVTLLF